MATISDVSIPCGFDFPLLSSDLSPVLIAGEPPLGAVSALGFQDQPFRFSLLAGFGDSRRDGLPMIGVAISTDDLDESAQRVVEILQISQQLRHGWPIPG
jgi:hypothetical protein